MKIKYYAFFYLFYCLNIISSLSIKTYSTDDPLIINYGNVSSFFSCPNENWYHVGTYCFYPAFSKLSWDEATYACSQGTLYHSYLLTTTEIGVLNNFFKNLNDFENNNYWSNWQSIGNDLNFTATFSNKQLSLNKSSFTWPVSYNVNEIKINLSSGYKYIKNKTLCLSVEKSNSTNENINYKLDNCLDKKSFICETFACFKDDFRCKDNSQCLPQIFRCNGYPDCPDNSDENDCVCTRDKIVTYDYKQKNGYITSPVRNSYNDKNEECRWEIIQENDEIIELTFMTLNLKDNEYLSISEPDSEVFQLSRNNMTILENIWRSQSNRVVINYHRSLQSPGDFKIFYKTITNTDFVQYYNDDSGIISYNKIGTLSNKTSNYKWILNNHGNKIISLIITQMIHDSSTFFTIKSGESVIDESIIMKPSFITTSLTSSAETIQVEMTLLAMKNVTISFEGLYQNKCSNITLNTKDFGQIFSPNYHQQTNLFYNCSWIIKPPCAKTYSGCFISINPIIANLIDGSYIKMSTDNDNIIIDNLKTSQSIYTFHLTSENSEILIEMNIKNTNFKAQLIYSTDCYLPTNLNGLIIEGISRISNPKNRNFYPITSTINFGCTGGKRLTPPISSKVECLPSGKWSSSFPTCFESLCPLPFIENGYIKYVEGYTLSSQLSYGCNLGYTSTNRNYTSICDEQQTFTPKPVCEAIRCPSDSNNLTLFNVLEIKENSCPIGFKTSFGSDRKQCGLDGKWRYSSYFCEEIKCFQEVIHFSTMIKERLYKFNDTIELDCLYGYQKSINQKVTCNEYGEWVDEKGKIVEKVECIKMINQNTLDCSIIGGCRNGGTCIFENGLLSCICSKGFFGSNCQYKSPLCNSISLRRCPTNRKVSSLINAYNKCPCLQGYLIHNENVCDKNPCLNNGSCKLIGNTNYYCKCREGFIGSNCEIRSDVCKQVGGSKGYCNGHGICIIKNRRPFCECMFLWKGKHCETPVNICQHRPNYCSNGGICTSLIGSSYPLCKCPRMYFGDSCEEKIDYCSFNPCFHNGICQNDIDVGYTCSCQSSYKGKACHINKGICSNNPCQNDGICVPQNDTSYVCICSNQYTGPNCSQFINLCEDNEKNGISYCNNRGICHSIRGESILCECRDDYSGDKCQYLNSKKEENYNLFFAPTKFYDFEYTSKYNNSLSSININQQLIFSSVFRSSFLNETTICGWIKPDISQNDNTSFIVVGTYNGKEIKEAIIEFTLTGVSLKYKKNIFINYKLVNNQWQHFCLRSPKLRKYDSTSWDFFHNGAVMTSARKGIEPLRISNRYIRILLGQSIDKKLKYLGEMSMIEYYSTLLSDEEILNLATKCLYTGSRPPIVSWLDYSDSTKSSGYVVKVEPGLCSESLNNKINNTLSALRDDTNYIPPYSLDIDYSVKIKNCSKDIFKYTDENGMIVEWKPDTAKDIFEDYLNLKKLYVNFDSGSYFEIGSYKIMYIGTNIYNIKNICQFTLNVLKNKNP